MEKTIFNDVSEKQKFLNELAPIFEKYNIEQVVITVSNVTDDYTCFSNAYKGLMKNIYDNTLEYCKKVGVVDEIGIVKP